jgi:hypothetical protein
MRSRPSSLQRIEGYKRSEVAIGPRSTPGHPPTINKLETESMKSRPTTNLYNFWPPSTQTGPAQSEVDDRDPLVWPSHMSGFQTWAWSSNNFLSTVYAAPESIARSHSMRRFAYPEENPNGPARRGTIRETCAHYFRFILQLQLGNR